MEQQDRITCPQCGRSGPYRPEMAGRRLKCKCGHVIQVPAADTPDTEEPIHLDPIAPAVRAAMVEEQRDEDEYDVAEPAPEPNRNVERPEDVIAYQSAPAEQEPPTKPMAPAFPAFTKPKTYSAGEGADQSQLIRLVVILAIVVAAIGGAVFGIRYVAGSHSASAGPGLPGEDADIEGKMQDEYCKEVHAWFQEDGSRMMGPWTQQQALSQVGRWQDMGAKQVFAFGSRLSTVAVIELPDDPAKRKQLFDWQAQWHGQHFEKIWPDVGQKYLMIRLGI
jgi:hypothetical protein